MSPRIKSEQTHLRILHAAAECLTRYGYDDAGVAEICRVAGLSKGAFYHHFPSKQAVFIEVLNRWLADLDARLGAFHTDETTAPEKLMAMAGMLDQVFQEAGKQLPMLIEFWSKAARDPLVWDISIKPFKRYSDFFAGIIEDGIAEGTLQPVEQKVGARVIVSLAFGILLQGLLDPEGADWKNVAQEGIRLLLTGMYKGDVQKITPKPNRDILFQNDKGDIDEGNVDWCVW